MTRQTRLATIGGCDRDKYFAVWAGPQQGDETGHVHEGGAKLKIPVILHVLQQRASPEGFQFSDFYGRLDLPGMVGSVHHLTPLNYRREAAADLDCEPSPTLESCTYSGITSLDQATAFMDMQ